MPVFVVRQVRHLSSFSLQTLPNGLCHPNILAESISKFRGVWCIFHFYFIFDRNSCKRSAASDLGLHCFPMSQKWDTKHEGVKMEILGIHRVIPFIGFTPN